MKVFALVGLALCNVNDAASITFDASFTKSKLILDVGACVGTGDIMDGDLRTIDTCNVDFAGVDANVFWTAGVAPSVDDDVILASDTDIGLDFTTRVWNSVDVGLNATNAIKAKFQARFSGELSTNGAQNAVNYVRQQAEVSVMAAVTGMAAWQIEGKMMCDSGSDASGVEFGAGGDLSIQSQGSLVLKGSNPFTLSRQAVVAAGGMISFDSAGTVTLNNVGITSAGELRINQATSFTGATSSSATERVTTSGTIRVAASAEVTFQVPVVSAAGSVLLVQTGGARFEAAGTILAAVTADSAATVVVLAGATTEIIGSVEAKGSATLTVEGELKFGAGSSVTQTATDGTSTLIVATSGTVMMTGAGTSAVINAKVQLDGSAGLTVEADHQTSFEGAVDVIGTGSVIVDGVASVATASTLRLAAVTMEVKGELRAAGQVFVEAGAELLVSAGATIKRATATKAPTSASPTITTSSPTVTTSSPTITTESPTSAPTVTTSVPTVTTESPTQLVTTTPTAAPTVTTATPTITTESPTVTTNSPTITTSSPTITTSSPTTKAPTTVSPTAQSEVETMIQVGINATDEAKIRFSGTADSAISDVGSAYIDLNDAARTTVDEGHTVRFSGSSQVSATGTAKTGSIDLMGTLSVQSDAAVRIAASANVKGKVEVLARASVAVAAQVRVHQEATLELVDDAKMNVEATGELLMEAGAKIKGSGTAAAAITTEANLKVQGDGSGSSSASVMTDVNVELQADAQLLLTAGAVLSCAGTTVIKGAATSSMNIADNSRFSAKGKTTVNVPVVVAESGGTTEVKATGELIFGASATLSANSKLIVEGGASTFKQITAGGSMTLDGKFTLDLSNTDFGANRTRRAIIVADSVTGTFSSIDIQLSTSSGRRLLESEKGCVTYDAKTVWYGPDCEPDEPDPNEDNSNPAARSAESSPVGIVIGALAGIIALGL